MSRSPDSSDRYEFSDTEKRDLIKLIEQGKPLPENTASSSSPTNVRSNSFGTAKAAKSARRYYPSKPLNTSMSLGRNSATRKNSASIWAGDRLRVGPINSFGATTS